MVAIEERETNNIDEKINLPFENEFTPPSLDLYHEPRNGIIKLKTNNSE